MAAEAVDAITKKSISGLLCRHIHPAQEIRTDTFPALNAVAEEHTHPKKVTPPDKAAEWLPLVHVMIGNFKTFLNGTFHGVSRKYLQEYVNGFCYLFNRCLNQADSTTCCMNLS
jgi:hypothetical protein